MLITGGASGIGYAIAEALAAEINGVDAELVLLGRNESALDQASSSLAQRHAELQTRRLVVDLAAPDQSFEEIAAAGDFDVLVHCAGAFSSQAPIEIDVAALERMFRVNVSGPLELTQLLIPGLVRRAGQIVFMGSSVVHQPVKANPGAYTMTKQAAAAMADALRDSLNPQGVRVLNVHPGRTATPMQESIVAAQGRDWLPERLLQPEDVAQTVVAALRLPGTAELTELSIRPFLKN